MDKIYQSLFDVLTEEENLYSKLMELAIEKKDAIVANDLESLTELLQNDTETIELLNQLDEQRAKLTKEICVNNDIQVQDISFKELIKFLPESWQENLWDIRNKLIAIIDELHQQNEQNKFLVNEAIKLNNASLNLFLQALEPENTTYNGKQKTVDKKSAHIIDRRG